MEDFFKINFYQEHCAGDLGQISQILSYFFIILPPHNDHNINQPNRLTLQQGKAQITARFVWIISGVEAGIVKQDKMLCSIHSPPEGNWALR